MKELRQVKLTLDYPLADCSVSCEIERKLNVCNSTPFTQTMIFSYTWPSLLVAKTKPSNFGAQTEQDSFTKFSNWWLRSDLPTVIHKDKKSQVIQV